MKMAIVDADESQVALFCVEAPDVRFETVISVPLNEIMRRGNSPTATSAVFEDIEDGTHTVSMPIDPVFLEVCEPGSITVVGHAATWPTLLGFEVIGNMLVIRLPQSMVRVRASSVTVKLSGIRKGQSDVYFPRKTREEMEHNDTFWRKARL